jgi:3-mercaptopyruvate sulfurtransferase SseA
MMSRIRTNIVMMSSMGYFVARYLGYRVRLYDGSMLEWTALGLPVEP